MIRCLKKTVFLLIILSIFSGCKDVPVPPEVREAELQEHDLWKAGADIYAPEEYKAYKGYLKDGKAHFAKEKERFRWFRDYKSIKEEFARVLTQGNLVSERIKAKKQIVSGDIAGKVAFSRDKIETIRRLTSLINEGRLSCSALTKAELLLKEACYLIEREQYPAAAEKLDALSGHTEEAMKAIQPILNRFADNAQITKWRSWVNETIEGSKRERSYSIVVSKIDRRLILYRNGKIYRKYEIGLGTNGSRDKLYSGDKATPEGKYRVIKKLPRSRFYKALLINYPNEDDRRQYAAARKKGLIPRTAGIGGLIEIHGGGKNGMTYGCVAMENSHVDELFAIVDVGTPVTIVGAVEYENAVSSTMKEL